MRTFILWLIHLPYPIMLWLVMIAKLQWLLWIMMVSMVQVTHNFTGICVSCVSHACALSGHTVNMWTCVWPDCIHVWIVHALSTYNDPHPCVLLQSSVLCRLAGLRKINHLNTKIADFLYLLHHNLTIYANTPKSFLIKWALSSTIYRNEILHSELNILAKVQLSVSCAHTVDFCRPDHKFIV